MSNYLIISEGKKPEVDLIREISFHAGVFCYSFNDSFDFNPACFQYFEKCIAQIPLRGDSIYFIVLKDPSLRKIIHFLRGKYNISIAELVSEKPHFFQGTFFLHDVDHYSCRSLKKLSDLLNTQENGFLLLSSPCVESVADFRPMAATSFDKPTQYRGVVRNSCRMDVIDYFRRQRLACLEKDLRRNCAFSRSDDFLTHGSFLANNVSSIRKRHKKSPRLCFSFFASQIYILLGFIYGIQYDENNCEKLSSLMLKSIIVDPAIETSRYLLLKRSAGKRLQMHRKTLSVAKRHRAR
jgi:hypothetical protein